MPNTPKLWVVSLSTKEISGAADPNSRLNPSLPELHHPYNEELLNRRRRSSKSLNATVLTPLQNLVFVCNAESSAFCLDDDYALTVVSALKLQAPGHSNLLTQIVIDLLLRCAARPASSRLGKWGFKCRECSINMPFRIVRLFTLSVLLLSD
jgi:hypothetical protein